MSLPTPSFHPGVVELDECLLFNYNRKAIDIRHLMVEFNVFSDLRISGTTCEIVLVDGNGLIEFMPIVGDEILVLYFKTPGRDGRKLRYVLKVVSVHNRNRINFRSESYVLTCVSIQVENNLRKSVNKSFTNMPINKMVEAIYESYLRPDLTEYDLIKTDDRLITEETQGDFHVVFPGIKPISAIRQLAFEAKSKVLNESLASNFIFFERSDAWYFKTIDSMLLEDAVDDFFLADANTDRVQTENDIQIKPYQKIEAFSIESHFDTLKNANDGFYTNSVETIDPITKQFTVDKYIYENNYDQISHLEYGNNGVPRKVYTENSVFKEETESYHSNYLVSNIGNYRASYFRNAIQTDPFVRNTRKIHTFLKYKHASKLQLNNNIVFNVTIPGNTNIEIGDVVNLHIPQTTTKTEFLKRLNLFYAKRFLVVAIRHVYNKNNNNFFTVMECVKDNYGRNPEEIE